MFDKKKIAFAHEQALAAVFTKSTNDVAFVIDGDKIKELREIIEAEKKLSSSYLTNRCDNSDMCSLL
jgi:hypothetical protein